VWHTSATHSLEQGSSAKWSQRYISSQYAASMNIQHHSDEGPSDITAWSAIIIRFPHDHIHDLSISHYQLERLGSMKCSAWRPVSPIGVNFTMTSDIDLIGIDPVDETANGFRAGDSQRVFCRTVVLGYRESYLGLYRSDGVPLRHPLRHECGWA